MLGRSPSPHPPSSFTGIHLAANGCDIIPVNPSRSGAITVDREVSRRVDKIDKEMGVVNVFRLAAEALHIARHAVKVDAALPAARRDRRERNADRS